MPIKNIRLLLDVSLALKQNGIFPLSCWFLSMVNKQLKKVKYKLTFFVHSHQIVNYHGEMLEKLYLVYLIASYQACFHKIKLIWSVDLVLFCCQQAQTMQMWNIWVCFSLLSYNFSVCCFFDSRIWKLFRQKINEAL